MNNPIYDMLDIINMIRRELNHTLHRGSQFRHNQQPDIELTSDEISDAFSSIGDGASAA